MNNNRGELEKAYNEGWADGFAFYDKHEKSSFDHIASARPEEDRFEEVLRDLESTYSGAKMFDDINIMVRTARAIEAFKLPTDKDCVIKPIPHDATNRELFATVFGFKPKNTSIYSEYGKDRVCVKGEEKCDLWCDLQTTKHCEWWYEKYENQWRKE